MKLLLFTLLILLFVQTDLKTKYDRFRDETTVSIGPDYVDMKSPGRLEAAAYFSHKGKTASAEGLIVGLAFYSSSKHWRFLDDDRLIAMADGERVDLGRPTTKDSKLGRYVGVDESLSFALTREGFHTLARASKVEMKLGRVEFGLKDKFLKRLKELESALPPEQAK